MLRFLSVIAIAALPAVAQSTEKDDECKRVGDMAYVVMVGRQGGMGLSDMIDGFEREPGSREIIIAAFEWPLMVTNEGKQTAWKEFRDQMTLRCYKGG